MSLSEINPSNVCVCVTFNRAAHAPSFLRPINNWSCVYTPAGHRLLATPLQEMCDIDKNHLVGSGQFCFCLEYSESEAHSVAGVCANLLPPYYEQAQRNISH